jgi:hypothetical protein
VLAADGAGWSLLDFDGAELHGLGVERQQAVGEQFADADCSDAGCGEV